MTRMMLFFAPLAVLLACPVMADDDGPGMPVDRVTPK